MWVLWNLVSVCLETMLMSVQDGCAVCAKRTIGSEIILDAPSGAPGGIGHVKSHFDPFGDVLVSVQVGAWFAPNVA
jgi:hypothetical protein